MNQEEKDELYRRIGKNVAEARKSKGLSQLKLCNEMGLNSLSIIASSEIYSNKKHFNIVHLMEIAKVLEVDVCELLKQD